MLTGPRALAAIGVALFALGAAPAAHAQQTDGKQNVTGGTEARPSDDGAARSTTRSMRPSAPPVGAASPPPMPAPAPGSVPAQAPKTDATKEAPKK